MEEEGFSYCCFGFWEEMRKKNLISLSFKERKEI